MQQRDWLKIFRRLFNSFGTKVDIFKHKKSKEVKPVKFLEHPLEAIYQHENVAFEIPLERVYYPYQYCYAIDGWHPFVRFLLEYSLNPAIQYEDSILCAYYQRYQPETIRDVFLFGETSRVGKELEAFPVQQFVAILPWDPSFVVFDRGERGLGKNHGHQGFGPVSKIKGELEFKRLIDTFKSIRAKGYRPAPNQDGEISGYFLRHKDDYRFIIRGGLHRTAVLAALGFTSIRVKFFHGYPRYVHTTLVEEWPLVKQGKIAAETALAVTERFFTDNGKAKAKMIGLIP